MLDLGFPCIENVGSYLAEILCCLYQNQTI